MKSTFCRSHLHVAEAANAKRSTPVRILEVAMLNQKLTLHVHVVTSRH